MIPTLCQQIEQLRKSRDKSGLREFDESAGYNDAIADVLALLRAAPAPPEPEAETLRALLQEIVESAGPMGSKRDPSREFYVIAQPLISRARDLLRAVPAPPEIPAVPNMGSTMPNVGRLMDQWRARATAIIDDVNHGHAPTHEADAAREWLACADELEAVLSVGADTLPPCSERAPTTGIHRCELPTGHQTPHRIGRFQWAAVLAPPRCTRDPNTCEVGFCDFPKCLAVPAPHPQEPR